MAFLNQPAGSIVRTGIVIEIKPRVRLRQLAAPKRQEREPGGLQLLKPRIAIQRMRHNQRVDAPALYHAHIAVLIRQIVIGNEQ
ncbi:Uncharacterised protein [Enterobacter kobei]|nr:Uncharacterised protein [Enterobacter kobei]VAL71108.1 Uncharacterised protein [Enterobacter kobei]